MIQFGLPHGKGLLSTSITCRCASSFHPFTTLLHHMLVSSMLGRRALRPLDFGCANLQRLCLDLHPGTTEPEQATEPRTGPAAGLGVAAQAIDE